MATNNVAEYRGLIAGLELAAEHRPAPRSRSGWTPSSSSSRWPANWKIKHPDMKPLAARGAAAGALGTTCTWVPREENKHADRLANEALDGSIGGDVLRRPRGGASREGPGRRGAGLGGGGPAGDAWRDRLPRLGARRTPTTLVLVRHGATPTTHRQAVLGRAGRQQPALNDEGRAQVRATAEWLAPLAGSVDALVTSPVRRTRESAEILAESPGRARWRRSPRSRRWSSGLWDGMTFTEVAESFKPMRWTPGSAHSTSVPGVEGESFRAVEKRVLAGRDRMLAIARRRPSSWSATSPRSRRWSPTRSAHRWRRSSGWS